MAQVKKPTLLDSGRGRFMNSEKVTFIISMPRSSLTEKYFFVGSTSHTGSCGPSPDDCFFLAWPERCAARAGVIEISYSS